MFTQMPLKTHSEYLMTHANQHRWMDSWKNMFCQIQWDQRIKKNEKNNYKSNTKKTKKSTANN